MKQKATFLDKRETEIESTKRKKINEFISYVGIYELNGSGSQIIDMGNHEKIKNGST